MTNTHHATRITHHIGTLNEKPLHAALKQYLARPDDRFEVKLNRFVIDLVRGEPPNELLIEVQTGSFSPLKRKLRKLTETHRVQLVYPIAAQKWIIKTTDPTRRRKSPKRGSIYDLFRELVYIPDLLINPNFSLNVLLIEQEDWREPTTKKRGRWKKGWKSAEKRLITVIEQQQFDDYRDLLQLLPYSLNNPFTTRELATAINKPQRLAQQMAYCLRQLNLIEQVGKQGNAYLYACSEGELT